MVCVNGLNLEKVVEPMGELLEKEEAMFRGIKYKDYFELYQTNNLDGNSGMDQIRIKPKKRE